MREFCTYCSRGGKIYNNISHNRGGYCLAFTALQCLFARVLKLLKLCVSRLYALNILNILNVLLGLCASKLLALIFVALAFVMVSMVSRTAQAQQCSNPSGYAGTIVYNASLDVFQGCTLHGWIALSPPVSPPPAFAFSFTDVTDVSAATLIESNIVQVSGIGTNVTLDLTGKGNPQLRSCSDATCATEINTWASGSMVVSDGNYLQLRLTSNENSLQTNSSILTDGTSQEIWSVRTEYVDDCSAANPAVGTVCADGTVYAGKTPDGNVKMYVTRCDAGQSWDGSTCTGSRYALPWNDGNGNYVTTNYISAVTGEANTAGIAPLDSNNVAAGHQDHVAVIYCNDLTQDGHDDWYLPARSELSVLYGNKDAIGNFDTSGAWYWSSSEYSNTYAWAQRFSDGSKNNYYNKTNNSTVRCARK